MYLHQPYTNMYKTPDERTIQLSRKGEVFAIQCSKPREDVNGFNEAFKTLLSLNNSNGSISYVWHFYLNFSHTYVLSDLC